MPGIDSRQNNSTAEVLGTSMANLVGGGRRAHAGVLSLCERIHHRHGQREIDLQDACVCAAELHEAHREQPVHLAGFTLHLFFGIDDARVATLLRPYTEKGVVVAPLGAKLCEEDQALGELAARGHDTSHRSSSLD